MKAPNKVDFSTRLSSFWQVEGGNGSNFCNEDDQESWVEAERLAKAAPIITPGHNTIWEALSSAHIRIHIRPCNKPLEQP